ncbi:maltose ABC transporter permease MalF [Chitinimonas sp. BJB300]|nr:maltose ABC transporter permease MalF [Chitinimonas sp. BJB300]TSJ88663.1 maltose ABC transporter permease MalF [Chitinimonas sp. BJB300]
MLLSLVVLAGLYLSLQVYLSGQSLAAVSLVAFLGLTIYVYTATRAYNYRYLFPGLVAVLLFVILPIAINFSIGFTNYSSKHLLSFSQATKYFLDQTYTEDGHTLAFTLHPDGAAYRIRLEAEDGSIFQTPPLALHATKVNVNAQPPVAGDAPLAAAVDTRTLIQNLKALKLVAIHLPNGMTVSAAGLREFAPVRKQYVKAADGSLVDQQDGAVLRPDMTEGFYKNAAGEAMQPGFTTGVGFAHYVRIVSDRALSEPLAQIFIWTVVFAGLSVVFAFSIGVILAVLMNWEALAGRGLYRVLLFIPYAVPGFISILVFKGLFNENSGEINLLLGHLFSINPNWFTDPFLAKTMLLIVNTWLGFPYMMLLCMGLIKAIPADLYEASAIAGAGPLTNFFKITLPLIAKPMTPLLISAFAFNFNNFVIVALLTGGRPDFLGTKIPAGTTDVLVSYTYRIAFEDSGQDFGLASALSTVIFLMVVLLSLVNMRISKTHTSEPA